jgi:predicted choloylglycine hydrolase
LFHAVYAFLERFLGVRWLWPGPGGEVIPRHENLAIPVTTIREEPDFAWRALEVGGAAYGMLGGQDVNTTIHAILGLPLSYQKEFELWCRRNRFGGLKVLSGHRTCETIPPEKYGRTHPEYYALSGGERDCKLHDGKHGNMPCLSHPDVIRLTSEYACARFEADPRLDACSIALNDGGEPCECEACLAVDEAAGAAEDAPIERIDIVTGETYVIRAKRSITDRLFWNHQQIAREVAARHPDKKLLTLLYVNFRQPPVTHCLPENVIGHYCIVGFLLWNPALRRAEFARLRRMHEYVPSLGIYEYYANGAWPGLHRLFPELVEQSVRAYYNAGARYFSTQPGRGFATNGINYYVLGRLLWNRKASAAEALDDYCRSGFGPAAGPVKRFLNGFAGRWRRTEGGTRLRPVPNKRLVGGRLYSEQFLARRRDDLDAADEKAGSDADVRARIEFLRKGLEYTTLYCRAARETLAVFKVAGARGSLEQVDATPEVRSAATCALLAWESYWQFVRENKGAFVFSEFWATYWPGMDGRRDELQRQLRRLAGADALPVPGKARAPASLPEHPRFESSGSPRRRGTQVGRRFRELIIRKGLEVFCPDRPSASARKHLRLSLKYTKSRFPALIAEMEGLAEGVGVPFERIWELNAFNAHLGGGCSALVVADRSGRVLLGSTTDFVLSQRCNFFVHRLRGRSVDAIMLQWAGTLWPTCGVNADGLACCTTSAPRIPGTTSDGLPQSLAAYLVLTSCADVPSAVALLSSIRFTGKGQNLGLADAEGRAAMVEKSGNRQGVMLGERVSLYRSNHFLTEELRRFNGSRASGNSLARCTRVGSALAGPPTADAYALVHDILSSHGVGGLCQHPETNDNWNTLQAAVVDPHRGWMEVCPEKPCRAGFSRISLKG